MSETKQCSACRRPLPATAEFFYRHKSRNDGLTGQCKTCMRRYAAGHKEAEAARVAAYRARHRDRLLAERREKRKKERLEHPATVRAADRQRYWANVEAMREKSRQQYYQNREARKAAAMARYYAERQTDIEASRAKYAIRSARYMASHPIRRLSNRVSKAISRTLANGKGGTHWESLLPYGLADLRAHLEAQFGGGMSWENYGKWHIDHIRPVSSFKFEKPEDAEFQQCWALSNLRPLWAKQNMRKGAKWDGQARLDLTGG